MKKYSTNAAIPSLSYLVHQFLPSHPKRDSSKYFTCRLPVIKKIQTKTKKNDNPEMHCANCTANNVKKVLVEHFYSVYIIMTSCDDKCRFNGFNLATTWGHAQVTLHLLIKHMKMWA